MAMMERTMELHVIIFLASNFVGPSPHSNARFNELPFFGEALFFFFNLNLTASICHLFGAVM